MDLKDFIKETVKAITSATHELQSELAATGAIVNPPTTSGSSDTFEVSGTLHTMRRVQNIEFDLALTTSSSTSGGGKAGVKVFVVEASAGASQTRTNEEVSRVKFSVPLALPPSDQEAANRQADQDSKARLEATFTPRQGPGANRR